MREQLSMKPTLTVLVDTKFKVSTADSSSLSPNEVVDIKAGTRIELAAYRHESNHVKFTIWKRENDINGRNTWYAFQPHVSLSFDGAIISLNPKVEERKGSGPSINLPGFQSKFYLNDPIIKGGSFTWAEATRDGTRIPPTRDVVEGMMRLAREAQRARDQIGKPFHITSWYRPPHINRAVGGASNSRHLYGDAIDVYVEGESGISLARKLSWWPGGLGIYANMPELLHLDARGHVARWGPGF